MSKEINLEEIFKKEIFFDTEDISVAYDDKGKRQILKAMKEACRQTLELATKNACVDVKKRSQFGKYKKWQNVKEGEEVDLFSYEMQCFVDKNSILDTFNQIK
jgi:predicted aldo/keto reductase-like oxidoreductase